MPYWRITWETNTTVTQYSALHFILVFSVRLFQEYILYVAVNCRSIYVPFINAYKYTILQVQ